MAMADASVSTASISSATFEKGRPQVRYRVPEADGDGFWPRLRISVDELGDGGIPPISTIISDVKTEGRVTLPVEIKAGRPAEVFGSIVYKSGRRLHLAPRIVRSP
jgi:hypothetical protein